MNLRVIYHVARADFLERTRSYGFLLTLAAMGYLVYQTAQGQVILQVDRYRGIFNSAWLGTMMALITSLQLSLVGLYLVKNTLARDERTRVGRILAATPMSNLDYNFGKALSNFAVLSAMLLVLALGAVVLQFTAGESRDFQLWQLIAPLLFIAVPSLAFIAALAVLFENLPVMRSGAGNVIWFFLWTFLLALAIQKTPFDFSGIGVMMNPLQDAVHALDPAGYKGGFSFKLGHDDSVTKLLTFVWNGFDWTPRMIGARLVWIGGAVAVVYIASLCFKRFDPARVKWRLRLGRRAPVATESDTPAVYGHLTQLRAPAVRSSFRLPGLLVSELTMLLMDRKWWWYLVLAGCVIASFVTPEARIAPWLWPVTLWSQLGTREKRFGTAAMIFSAPSPGGTQLLATYLGGVATAAVAGMGGFFWAALHADATAFSATLACVLFVPALALALGVWSGTGKFFEALYVAWWYMGPTHALPGFDFVGVSAASQAPARFALYALALLVAAFIGRARQTAYPIALHA